MSRTNVLIIPLKAWSDEPAERPSPAEMVEELKKIQAVSVM